MSIYNQSMSDLNIADVQELLSEAAIENVRLEFKKEIPGRDEMLKKLSAFANTYGGYLIIGAEADSTTGRILGLPGVDLVPGLKQRVIQWCQEWLWPPISPLVSDPHTLPADPQRACYGIFVEESDEAPHFINARKGAYIRTDELSHRFEPRLATYEELQHLANRRSLAVVRRGQLLERAERRFESYAKMKAASRPATRGPLGATIKLAICPRFPITRLCEQQRLFMLLREQTIPWRGTRFPLLQSGAFLSQFESIIILDPTARLSFLEANEWGQLYYAGEIEDRDGDERGIHLDSFIGYLLAYVAHARHVYTALGFNGTLQFALRLDHIIQLPFWDPGWDDREASPSSPLDDSVEFQTDSSAEGLRRETEQIAVDLLRVIFSSVNWIESAVDERLSHLLQRAYRYNGWKSLP